MGNILNDGKKLELEQNYIFWPALIFSACYIALFIWLGFYQWPQADDWVFALNVQRQGQSLFDFVGNAYMGWSARIVQFTLMWLLLQLPINYYGLYVLFSILLYILAAYFLVNTLCYDFKLKLKILLTLIIVAVTLGTMESMNETLYWLAAMHYIWSEAFLIFAFALALKALNGSKGAFILCLIILFIDGITLEQPVIFSGVAAFLAAIYYLYKGDRQKFLICAVFWLACIAGFLVMYLAPGTAVRLRVEKESVNNFDLPLATFVLRMLRISFLRGAVTAFKFFISPIIYVFILFVPCIAERINFKLRLKAWHIVLCMMITAVAMQAICAFAAGYALAPRAETFALWFMLAVWVFMFGFCYRNEKVLSCIKNLKIFKLRWLALILCLVIAPNFGHLIRDLKIAPAYWADHDERIEIMLNNKQHGIEDFAVPYIHHRPTLLFNSDLLNDTQHWVNKSYANYFGANNIVSAPRTIYKDEQAVQRWLNGDISVVNVDVETNPRFIYAIANMYDSQSSSKNIKDDAKAIELYTRAAHMGDNQANRSLARVYLTNPKYKNYLTGAYWLARYIIGSIFPFAI